MLHFIIGGVSSGKSKYAEHKVMSYANVIYIATAATTANTEFNIKIAKHQKRRPPHWLTVHCPIHLDHTIQNHPNDCILIDCLSMWLLNCMENTDHTDQRIQSLKKSVEQHCGHIWLISNEIGLGGIGASLMVRDFQRHLGELNQEFAKIATHVHYITCGIPQIIK